MKTLVLLILLFPLVGFGMDRLTALSMIETGHNDRMVGKAGEISRYQIRKSVWRRVTRSTHYTDPRLATRVAARIIKDRVERFKGVYGREPNHFEFYALWNAPTQILHGRISRRVAERCQRFANLCERDEYEHGIAQAPVRSGRPKV
jgi:hypothetical protein